MNVFALVSIFAFAVLLEKSTNGFTLLILGESCFAFIDWPFLSRVLLV